ncbi:hypothetical protein O1Q96_00080 (plasmid) [Streptomyces sp. Qhu-G9]|uniref:hypothetical protein n=1 Tax=Streptomyces sp. Qhu-G9 TaxID=3452799 RepID=UPI0022AC4F9D|nr:hypothetical protein [Streptomyces aurantiacus]WAU78289.1 hypothetical protein O1Q96_00080 [Streptomyces aurantiacus]
MSMTVAKTDEAYEMREDSGEFGDQGPFRVNCVSFKALIQDVKAGKYDEVIAK